MKASSEHFEIFFLHIFEARANLFEQSRGLRKLFVQFNQKSHFYEQPLSQGTFVL